MLSKETARRLLDAVSLRFEAKSKASAATFRDTRFEECADPAWWMDPTDRKLTLTTRTLGYLAAYAMMSGGSIPLTGLVLEDGYFRPDQYIVRALLFHELIAVRGEGSLSFHLTAAGWHALADFMQGTATSS